MFKSSDLFGMDKSFRIAYLRMHTNFGDVERSVIGGYVGSVMEYINEIIAATVNVHNCLDKDEASLNEALVGFMNVTHDSINPMQSNLSELLDVANVPHVFVEPNLRP